MFGPSQVLIESTVAVPIARSSAVSNLSRISSMAKPIEAPPAINMDISAITLVRREMQRLASQLRIIGPNKSLFSNLLCH